MKLTTPEQKLIELAKMDGWTEHEATSFTGDIAILTHPTMRPERLPDYLTSYDAIIPLIQKQDRKIQIEITRKISGKQGLVKWVRTTPSQLADALLTAKGFELV